MKAVLMPYNINNLLSSHSRRVVSVNGHFMKSSSASLQAVVNKQFYNLSTCPITSTTCWCHLIHTAAKRQCTAVKPQATLQLSTVLTVLQGQAVLTCSCSSSSWQSSSCSCQSREVSTSLVRRRPIHPPLFLILNNKSPPPSSEFTIQALSPLAKAYFPLLLQTNTTSNFDPNLEHFWLISFLCNELTPVASLQYFIYVLKITHWLLVFQWCTFKHAEKMCEIEWKRTPYNVTMGTCDDYEGRVEFKVRQFVHNSTKFYKTRFRIFWLIFFGLHIKV